MIKIIPGASKFIEYKRKGRLLPGHRMHGSGIEE